MAVDVVMAVVLADVDLASLDSSQGFKIDGAATLDYVGTSVSSGDINGDGLAEVIIGASGADPFGRQDAGEVYVIWGTNTQGNHWNRHHIVAVKLMDGVYIDFHC